MTGFQRPGVAIARPYAARLPGIFGDHADDARVRGTPAQRFRMIADAMTSRRQVGRTLLMRFGFTPIRGSNPRASATDQPLRRPCAVAVPCSAIIFRLRMTH